MDVEGGPGRDRIRSRLARWRETGDLLALWPEVEPARMVQAHRALRDVAAGVLGGALRPPAIEAPSEADVRALGAAAFVSGMGPLTGWWIENGFVHASPEVEELMARHLEHGRRRTAHLREHLVDLARAMRRAGVDPIALKGLHTGAVYFPEPGTRTGADIDVLVRPEEREAATAALRELGYSESRSTAFGARSEWCVSDGDGEVHSLELDHAENPWTLDLHNRLERWYFRGMRRDLGPGAFESTVRVSFGGQQIRVLDQPYLAAFLGLHASHDVARTRLVRIVELALVIRADTGNRGLDWGEFRALLVQTGTVRFVHPALDLVERLAPATVDADLLGDAIGPATARARRVVDAVWDAGVAPLFRPSLDAKLMWARGPLETLRNATELIVPSDDGMDGGAGAQFLRRARAIVSGRARLRAQAEPVRRMRR